MRRRRVLTVVGGLLACAALATAGVLVRDHTPGRSTTESADGAHRTPTAVPVDYHVTGHGTVQITYADATDRLHTETASLPWSHSTRTHIAALSITLGKGGTTATCTVTVHGAPVQQATATGPYGRANCRAPLVTGTGAATGATP